MKQSDAHLHRCASTTVKQAQSDYIVLDQHEEDDVEPNREENKQRNRNSRIQISKDHDSGHNKS